MTEIEQNTEKLIQFISSKFEAEKIDNKSLIQIIELCGSYLNMQTISTYAKDTGISYNGAKNFRKPVVIFGVKFIIDNE